MNLHSDRNSHDPLEQLLLALKRNHPVIGDRSGIPLRVLESIRSGDTGHPAYNLLPSRRRHLLSIAQRLLTAASVAFLLIYGMEEYTVVKKVNTLEKRMASMQAEPAKCASVRFAKRGPAVTSVQQLFRMRDLLIAEGTPPVSVNHESPVKQIRP